MKPHKQFFTSCVDDTNGWCPIDHFFYATYNWTPEKGLSEKGHNTIWLEGVADKVLVWKGSGKHKTFDNYPAALRYMADLMEGKK